MHPTQGTVVNRLTRDTIPEAIVTAETTRPIPEYSSLQNIRTTSDTRGDFAIGPLYPNYEYTIFIEKKGYAGREFKFISTGNSQKFTQPFQLLSVPNEDAMYYIDVAARGKYNKIPKVSPEPPIHINAVDIKFRIGGAGSTTYTHWYIPKNDIPKNLPQISSKATTYLMFSLNPNEPPDITYRSNKPKTAFVIYPLKFFDRLPVDFEDSSGNKVLAYHTESNVYLFGKSPKPKGQELSSDTIPMESMKPETWTTQSKKFIIVSLESLDEGLYLAEKASGGPYSILFEVK